MALFLYLKSIISWQKKLSGPKLLNEQESELELFRTMRMEYRFGIYSKGGQVDNAFGTFHQKHAEKFQYVMNEVGIH